MLHFLELNGFLLRDRFLHLRYCYIYNSRGYYPFLGQYATLQVEPADLHKKLMPTPRHTEPSNFFWLHTPQKHLLIN